MEEPLFDIPTGGCPWKGVESVEDGYRKRYIAENMRTGRVRCE